MAGGEDAGEFEMFCGRMARETFRPIHRPGDHHRNCDRMGRQPQSLGKRERGWPSNTFDAGSVGPPLKFVQRDRKRLPRLDQITNSQTLVVGAAGAHEQHSGRPKGAEETCGSRCGRHGAHAGEGHLPTWGRIAIQAGQFRRKGCEKKRGPGPGLIHGRTHQELDRSLLRTSVPAIPTIAASHDTGAAITSLAAFTPSGSLSPVAAILALLELGFAVFTGFPMGGCGGARLSILGPGTRLRRLGSRFLRAKGWTPGKESQEYPKHEIHNPIFHF